ncbi:MAG: gluconolaconase [Sphingomonas sp.]
MAPIDSRYAGTLPATAAEGWSVSRVTPPSRLFGANGLRTGADGRVYVAQVSGSQISAINVDSGAIDTISAMGGDIVAPDDLAFDDRGNLFATEITEGRVSMLSPNGVTRVVNGDMPGANPITWAQGRLFAGECRPGGRVMELDLNGGAPRVLLEDVPMPNAMEVGPDGLLYVPIMGANEIWRVGLDGGAHEVVATGLGVPDAVKFDAAGRIVSTQVHSGQVLRIDPRTGAREVLADIAPGLDNLAFVGERLFVSSISGQVNEILAGGRLRSLVPDGFNWPLGLAMGADGVLFAADGPYSYLVARDGARTLAGMLFTPGCPGYVRGVAAEAAGAFLVTTANGQVARWRPAEQTSEPIADGYDRLYGIARNASGAIAFAEAGAGRVLLASDGGVEVLGTGLAEPMGVAFGPDGACIVSESGAGRIVAVAGGRAETLVDGMDAPQGIAVVGTKLYVVDARAKTLVEQDLAGGARRVIARDLPVGAPAGVTPKFLRAIPPLSGPMGPFAGIAAGADGTLYVSGDAEGSVLAIRPD